MNTSAVARVASIVRTTIAMASAGWLLAGCGGGAHTTPTSVVAAADTPTRSVSVAVRPTPSPKVRKRAAPAMVSCDDNVRVRARTTTCPFGQNVFYSYWLAQNVDGVFADMAGVPAYSPALDELLYLDCSGTTTITCRTDRGGVVQFPETAVITYTPYDAQMYADSNDLGGVPDPTSVGGELTDAADPYTDDGAGSEDCDPNYEGQCLDPYASDYDCEGGSGNGPLYTGPVQVVGDDPYGLDRDGDGFACE